MQRVWATERPFELALDGVVVSGGPDVILDQHMGFYDSLAIVDYKTAIGDRELGLQLQVYTEAGIREGLSVDGAFLHDLDAQKRLTVDISLTARQSAISVIVNAAQGIKDRNLKQTLRNCAVHVVTFGPFVRNLESECKLCFTFAI